MTYQIVVVAGDNEALRALPEQLGDTFEVKLIESPNEALWEVRSQPPDVIVADVNVPEMSGIEMAEILPNFDVPTRLVLCSNTEDTQSAEEAKSLGVAQFLHGEWSFKHLKGAIEAAASQAAEEAAAQAEEDDDEDEDTAEPASSDPPAASVEAKPDPEPAPPPDPEPEPKPSSAAPERKSVRTRRLRGTGGLAARTRAIAAEHRASHSEKPAAQQPHEEDEEYHWRQRRPGGTLVLDSDNLNPIRTIMSQLSQELGPQCVLLTDRAGMVLVEVGTTDKLPVMILLPLLSTSFATSGEVSRQLGEEDATTLYIHEGLNYDLYCFDVAQSYLLVLIFNKKIANSKIGAVWVNTKRTIRELQHALTR
jgi:DNA-binding NarL/FixJ family response regulator